MKTKNWLSVLHVLMGLIMLTQQAIGADQTISGNLMVDGDVGVAGVMAVGGNVILGNEEGKSRVLGSTAFGYDTDAPGWSSVAFGEYAVASGWVSSAFGSETRATGGVSVAFGNGTSASGWGSVAFGDWASASEGLSVAIGSWVRASAPLSVAFGSSTRAIGHGQFVIGKGNIPDANQAFIIGNGSYTYLCDNEDGDPSNAFMVNWQGDVWAGGNLSLGGSSTNARVVINARDGGIRLGGNLSVNGTLAGVGNDPKNGLSLGSYNGYSTLVLRNGAGTPMSQLAYWGFTTNHTEFAIDSLSGVLSIGASTTGGTSRTLQAQGSQSNINLTVQPKGSGITTLVNLTANNSVLTNASLTSPLIFHPSAPTVPIRIGFSNYHPTIRIANNPQGNAPYTDYLYWGVINTHSEFAIQTATGILSLGGGTSNLATQTIQTIGTPANIDMILKPKGAGNLIFTSNIKLSGNNTGITLVDGTRLSKAADFQARALVDGNAVETMKVGGNGDLLVARKIVFAGLQPYACDGDGENLMEGGVFSMGWCANASGLYSIAFGIDTNAVGSFSAAFGSWTSALASESVAFGSYTTASGGSSAAFGSGTTASGGASAAFGYETTASGGASVAFGSETTASGWVSTAFGSRTQAVGHRQFVIGQSNAPSVDPIFIVGNGTTLYDCDGEEEVLSNAFTIDWSGNVWVGGNITATGAEFGGSVILKSGGIILSDGTYISKADDIKSNTSGPSNTLVDLGTGRTVVSIDSNGTLVVDGGASFGMGSKALDIYSVAFGETTTASSAGVAFGTGTQAYGWASAAFGENAQAHGWASVAFGHNTGVSGDFGVVFGVESGSDGVGAVAFGYKSSARGDYSVAMGQGTVSNGVSQVVVGQYNIPNGTASTNYPDASGLVFIVGNGTEGTRSNAFSVGMNGDAWIGGNIIANGTLNSSALRGEGESYIGVHSDGTLYRRGFTTVDLAGAASLNNSNTFRPISSGGAYTEGIRINDAPNKIALVHLGGNSVAGSEVGEWTLAKTAAGDFKIETNGSSRLEMTNNQTTIEGVLTANRLIVPGNAIVFESAEDWSGATVVTNSIEIVSGTAAAESAPTLALHQKGAGGAQFRLVEVEGEGNVLFIEAAEAGSAGKANAPAASNGLKKLQISGELEVAGDTVIKGKLRMQPAGDLGMGGFTSGPKPSK